MLATGRNDWFLHAGVRYRVVRWGAQAASLGSGMPLILVHGFSQSSASWAVVAPELASSRPVYAIDLVGHGESERPASTLAYELDAQADALLAFGRAVAAKEGFRPAVLGYSMGGRVTLTALERAPHAFAAVILESAGLGPATPVEREGVAERDARSAARLRADGVEAFMNTWEQLPLFATQRDLPAAARARLRAARLDNDAEALARTFEHAGQHVMPDRSTTLSTLASLCEQSIPLLYVAGACDAKYAALAEELAAAFLGETRIVAQAGHNVHLEAPSAFVSAVTRFLSAC